MTTYEIASLIVGIVGAIATIAVAVVVQRFSHRANNIAIDRAIADGWARYSEILLQPGNSEIFQQFLESKTLFLPQQHQRVHHIILIFLNNAQYEWQAMQSTLYSGNSPESVRGLFEILVNRSEYVLALMQANGYSPAFIAFARSAMNRSGPPDCAAA